MTIPDMTIPELVTVQAAAKEYARYTDERMTKRQVDGIAHALAAAFRACERLDRNQLAEAFIRGIEAGAEEPSLVGDGDAMYDAFRHWADALAREFGEPT